MKRLYMVCCAALQQHNPHVGIAVHLDYRIASSGDEISEFGWQRAREAFPPERGFTEHHVMIRTVDDDALGEMLDHHNSLVEDSP